MEDLCGDKEVIKTLLKHVNEPIEFLFIDGDHEYNAVKLDFDLWEPKVMNGGIIAFHDSNAPGPGKVTEHSLFKSKYFKDVKYVDSITYGVKVEENTLADRIKNRFTLLRRDTYYSIMKLVYKIPAPVKKVIKTLLGRK